MATASVDRLEQCRRGWRSCSTTTPARRWRRGGCATRCSEPGARAVVAALAEELAAAPRLDRERFRAIANQVKAKTGQKGKALFHPIRVALTGRAEGPELDLAVPAIDRGAELPRDRRHCRRSSAAASARRRSLRGARRRRSRDAPMTSRSEPRDDDRMMIYGINPVLEALRAGRVTRAARVARAPTTRVDEIVALAASAGRAGAARATPRSSIARRAAACTRAWSPTSSDARDYSVEDLVARRDGRRR